MSFTRLALMLGLLLAGFAGVANVEKIKSAIDFHFGIVRSTRASLDLGKKQKIKIKEKKAFLKKNPGKGDKFEESNKIDCNPVPKCKKQPYRSADGTCNNLKDMFCGAASIPYRRFLKPRYNDGISTPRMHDSFCELLPSAREVSRLFHTSDEKAGTENVDITHMVMQWGQFLDHDISITPVQAKIVNSTEGETIKSLSCCDGVGNDPTEKQVYEVDSFENCFPIPIASGDQTFGNKSCMHFVRSVQVRNAECKISPVEQINQITAFIDASNVYGSSDAEMESLRQKTGGLLKVGNSGETSKQCPNDLMPWDVCQDRKCFKAGDVRAAEQIGLTSLHTIFVREHNRIAYNLTEYNRHWDDEKIFQETRKIVGAMMQIITYKEFLPLVLGSELAKYTDVKPSGDIDPSVRNAFATAAFRFGHSQIRGLMSSLYPDETKSQDDTALSDLFGQADLLLSNQCLAGEYLRGLCHDSCPKVDRLMSPEVTERLFKDKNQNSLDLAALNIQRGRDHGLPGYNDWRRFCQLPEFKTFENMTEHTEEERTILQTLYSSPDEIDLFTAGVSESHVEGGIVGKTFSCLIGKQFQALKYGDRFWYETEDGSIGFSKDQLAQLNKVTLAKVLCSCTNTANLQPKCMEAEGENNKRTACSEILKDNMQLGYWKEE